MLLCVLLLICGPVLALIYIPFATRHRQFQLTPARALQRFQGQTPAASKGLNALQWSREAEEHFRSLRNPAA